MPQFHTAFRILTICVDLLGKTLDFLRLTITSRTSLAAEVLFLRKPLAFYQERKTKPRRFDDSARVAMLLLAKLFDWKSALINVRPETLIGWHRNAFRLFWRWKSRGGRPQLPRDIRRLIVEMAVNNPTWGQERVADELSLKLGIRVSPRTVRKYWPDRLDCGPGKRSTQQWSAFVRNHAKTVIACDFATVVTAHFRRLYVLVIWKSVHGESCIAM